MKKILIRDIVKAVNGIFYGNKEFLDKYISNVNTDSRKKVDNSLFIPLIGEKFDAHEFIDQAFLNGAECVLSERILMDNNNFIKVSSTNQALLDLAEYYRSLFDIKVVAITGSCGKTTTKDMIANVLSQSYNVLKTKGNFNNQVGLPLTIFELEESTQIAVLEMGTNHFGEIETLSKVAKPDVCVITNIGVSHIENFKNQLGILKAKSEIFTYAKNNFVAILNGDDEYLRKLNLKNVIYYGFDVLNNIFAYNVKANSFSVNNFSTEITLNYVGKHMIKNALAAIAVGRYFNMLDEKIKFGLENFKMSAMRMEILHSKNNFTIINDVYNASPDSMRIAIDVLSDADSHKKKICILGDMFELGEQSEKFHFELGKYLANKKVDLAICIGKIAKNIFDGIDLNIKKKYYQTKEDFFCDMKNIFWDNSVILIKASRGMHFEDITEKLMR